MNFNSHRFWNGNAMLHASEGGTEESYTSYQYYLVRPARREGIDVNASEVEWVDKEKDIWRKIDGVLRVMDAKANAGRHLWNCVRARVHRFVASELHDAMKERGMTTLWQLERQKISDRSAVAAD